MFRYGIYICIFSKKKLFNICNTGYTGYAYPYLAFLINRECLQQGLWKTKRAAGTRKNGRDKSVKWPATAGFRRG